MKTIFVNDITLIDFAMVTSRGYLKGNSARLHANISGRVDEHEQVVIDFSQCKKQIKHIIDNTDVGIDHKLVILPSSDAKVAISDNVVTVETPVCTVIGDKNVTITFSDDLEEYLNVILSEQLSILHNTKIDVKCTLDYTPVIPFNGAGMLHNSFSYVHGLKTSSSHGCQNIAHGHLSYVAVDAQNHDLEYILHVISRELSGVVFMNRNDVQVDENKHTLKYESLRGSFEMTTEQNVILMDTDSTVENMIDYVVAKYGTQLKHYGATTLWVSEGLVKGAMVKL